MISVVLPIFAATLVILFLARLFRWAFGSEVGFGSIFRDSLVGGVFAGTLVGGSVLVARTLKFVLTLLTWFFLFGAIWSTVAPYYDQSSPFKALSFDHVAGASMDWILCLAADALRSQVSYLIYLVRLVFTPPERIPELVRPEYMPDTHDRRFNRQQADDDPMPAVQPTDSGKGRKSTVREQPATGVQPDAGPTAHPTKAIPAQTRSQPAQSKPRHEVSPKPAQHKPPASQTSVPLDDEPPQFIYIEL